MKRHKCLYPQIVEFENLRLAFKRAARGKRSRPDVADFEYHLEENLLALQDELLGEIYRPGSYYNFRIYDPKPRLISAAPFRDRVVHHALCRVTEPLFERRFIPDSYACRPGKGTHAALDRAQAFARRYPYVLRCDIERFFPSLDHVLLQAQFERIIADEAVLRLCALILEGGAHIHKPQGARRYFPGDDLFAALRPVGLPIGNLTSQLWANLYLNPLDHFVKRQLKCPAYLRYCDDFLLFAADKASLHHWKKEIIAFLAGLRLALHESRAVVSPVSCGIPFLGWQVYPDHRRLRRYNGLRFQRRFAQMRADYAVGRLSKEQMDASIRSWIAHAAHGQTWGLRRALLTRCAVPARYSAVSPGSSRLRSATRSEIM
ncbi:MAG: group II intron reverse transcriptase domain-containing protein [Anaerolineales bacterium]|nr:group II intron reverse transcriptase domain-containing protein [Anaerolineales bacterium]